MRAGMQKMNSTKESPGGGGAAEEWPARVARLGAPFEMQKSNPTQELLAL